MMKPTKLNLSREKFYNENKGKLTYGQMAGKPPFENCRNAETVRGWCKRVLMPNKCLNIQATRTSKKDKNTKLVELLKERGRTEQEIQQIGMKWNDAFKIAKKAENFSCYIQRNEYNERVMALIREIDNSVKILPRAFTCSIQKEGQPYLWTQFPRLNNGGSIDRLNLFPLADFHYGHKACDVKTIKQDIEFVRANKNVYAFLNGDIIENASKLSVASGVYEQTAMPNEQISYIVKMLAPIAHKIIFSIQGNHEERTYIHLGIDIGQIIADKLNIPYFREPVYVDLLWRNYRWTLFSQHGASFAQTKGGKMNAATRPLTWNDFTNFTVYAHVHDKISNEITRIVRDPVNFRLLLKKQYVIVCSAYLKHFGTYGARKGYPPTSRGRTMLKMFSNGKYYVSQ